VRRSLIKKIASASQISSSLLQIEPRKGDQKAGLLLLLYDQVLVCFD
jgi:hypothetical protein